MILTPWKRHLALAALALAPVLTASGLGEGRAPSPAAVPPEVHKATAFFTKGAELFKAKKFAPALEEFKQSYALLASPNTHLYIARCLAGPRRQARGVARVRSHRGGGADRGAQVRARARRRAPGARRPHPQAGARHGHGAEPGPGDDGHGGDRQRAPGSLGKPYPVEPGTLDVVVQAPGKPPVKQTLTIGAGEQREARLDTAPAAPAPGPGQGDQGAAPAHGMSPLRIGAFVAGGRRRGRAS